MPFLPVQKLSLLKLKPKQDMFPKWLMNLKKKNVLYIKFNSENELPKPPIGFYLYLEGKKRKGK